MAPSLTGSEFPTSMDSNLVAIAKLINDTGLNSLEKQRHPKIVEFITLQRPKLLQTVHELVVSDT
jgi:hypothetical protein